MISIAYREDNLKSYLLRFVVAFSQILDGIIGLISLGLLTSKFALTTSKILAKSRIKENQ